MTLLPFLKPIKNNIFCKYSSLFGIYGPMPLAFTDLLMKENSNIMNILDNIFMNKLLDKKPININNFFNFFPSSKQSYVLQMKYVNKLKYNTLGICKLHTTILGNRIVYMKKLFIINEKKIKLGVYKLGTSQ